MTSAVHGPRPGTDDQWATLVASSARRLEDGSIALHYDPAIRVPYAEVSDKDVELWPFWDRIGRPTFVLRGAESRLLLPATAEEMQTRGPQAEVHEVAGVGHAPALMAPDQIAVIEGWLGVA